ncbi:hypothetical protein J4408_03150 [Candidatus Pacearchaeota archaeon]|nr:hypothetical protein [Candidatus Pacearchaeota archaeon]
MKINKTIISMIFISFLLITSVSAYTELSIYIDEKGSAEFYGLTDSDMGMQGLSEGISVNEGEIRGKTQLLTSKSSNVWTFSYYLEDTDINVYLPENALIKKTNGEVSLSRGRILVYSYQNISINYILEEQESSTIPLTLAILVVLILLGLIIRYIINKPTKKTDKEEKSNKKQQKLEIIKKVLNDREKIILDNLKKTGKIKQNYLRKLCDIPKASFSRHIQELEKKSLINRSGEGKNKFIELSK